MTDVFLSLDGLDKTFEGSPSPAVSDVSFSMPKGEILALLGPSGCGKTTTLRLIAGFETPDRGTIRIGGRIVQSDEVELRLKSVASVSSSRTTRCFHIWMSEETSSSD